MFIDKKDWESVMKNEANKPFFDAVIEAKKPINLDKLVAIIIKPEYVSKAEAFKDIFIGFAAITFIVALVKGLLK